TPTFQLVERVPSPGQTVDLGDIMLRRGATLTGFVADDDGNPLGGALVRATDLPGVAFTLVPIERIDPRGAAVIRERPPEVVVEFPSWGVRIFESLPIPTT